MAIFGLFLLLVPLFPPLSIFFRKAASFIMPATPPPSPPSSSIPLTHTPPTSPQLHQQAIRHQERLQRQMGSPELRRIPAPSMALLNTFPPPPPPPVSASVTFNGQTYNHLPAHIMSSMRNLQPFPTSSMRRQNTRSPSVSYLLLFK